MSKVFITGTAGFIGFHLANLLLREGFLVHGFDGMTSYYDVALKTARNNILIAKNGYKFTEGMLENDTLLRSKITELART